MLLQAALTIEFSIVNTVKTCLIRSPVQTGYYNNPQICHLYVIYVQSDLPNAATCLIRSGNCDPE